MKAAPPRKQPAPRGTHSKSTLTIARLVWAVMLLSLVLAACASPIEAPPSGNIKITIAVDGEQKRLELPGGTTTQTAIETAGLTLGNLDRVEPPSYTVLQDGAVINITRVREVFTIEEKVVPFERQTVRNESLPEGQLLLVQTGINGVQQITYRDLYENDQQISHTVFKTEMITEPLAEITMVGVQKPFAPVAIPGKLAYLAGGNAWLMETSTGTRRPLVTTGDLDGRIFSLSPKGDWLLYTRRDKTPVSETSETPNINSLWVVDVTAETPKPISLRVNNIVRFADWVPGKGLSVVYSTVEPRSTAPGWQANNDLQLLSFTSSGMILKSEEIIPSNAGGVYGWWGGNFMWSEDGRWLAYARPDGVGLVDMDNNELIPVASVTPYQTGSDWAWVPSLGWAKNGQVLYFVTHAAKPGLESQEASPLFDLAAMPISELTDEDEENGLPVKVGPLIPLITQAGMFSNPAPSPLLSSGGYRVAYLQAIFPEQSDNERYRLVVMDRDGSNRQIIFPPQDYQGLKPQPLVWSPQPFSNGSLWLAVVYQENLWLVDAENGQVQQVTGDGLVSRIDWK